MKPKTLIVTVLCVFVAATAVVAVMKAMSRPAQEEDAAAAPQDQVQATAPAADGSADSGAKLIVYYFHGNKRCISCEKIEAYTKQAVTDGFKDQLDFGRVELKIVNTDEPGNAHFLDDYSLYTKSVVLVDMADGKEQRFKNLEDVWLLLDDPAGFVQYVTAEMQAFLGGESAA